MRWGPGGSFYKGEQNNRGYLYSTILGSQLHGAYELFCPCNRRKGRAYWSVTKTGTNGKDFIGEIGNIPRKNRYTNDPHGRGLRSTFLCALVN